MSDREIRDYLKEKQKREQHIFNGVAYIFKVNEKGVDILENGIIKVGITGSMYSLKKAIEYFDKIKK